DLFVLKPLSVQVGATSEFSVNLTPAGDGYQFLIQSGIGANRLEHVSGAIGPLDERVVQHDIPPLPGACHARTIDEDVLLEYRASKKGGYLALGKRWNNTKHVLYGEGEVLAEHQLPEEFQDDVATYKLHPAFTDFTALFPLYQAATELQYVPFSYDAVRV